MTVLVSGDKPTLNFSMPLLEVSFKNIIYLGKLGNASLIKTITNALNAVNLQAIGEALVLAKKAGIDLNEFFKAVRVSCGNSFAFETEVPFIFNNNYDTDFAIKL